MNAPVDHKYINDTLGVCVWYYAMLIEQMYMWNNTCRVSAMVVNELTRCWITCNFELE